MMNAILTPRIILATLNAGKTKEIKSILAPLQLEIISMKDMPGLPEITEDGSTLQENALTKAREIYRASRIPALSDDTGLEVYWLGMKPGVYSARYSGENATYESNNRKLLAALENVPEDERGARFRCVSAFVGEGFEKTEEGICTGRIIREVRGRGGFGYDPIFLPDGFHLTFAELEPEVKNRISHRAEAFRKIKTAISQYFSNL